jgi:hypothetical protein
MEWKLKGESAHIEIGFCLANRPSTSLSNFFFFFFLAGLVVYHRLLGVPRPRWQWSWCPWPSVPGTTWVEERLVDQALLDKVGVELRGCSSWLIAVAMTLG